VQRDIRRLEQDGLVRRVRGGALPPAPGPVRFGDRVDEDATVKARIAAAVVATLGAAEVVALGGGTTMVAVARALGSEPRTLVTTAPDVALAATARRPDLEVVLPGGRLEPESRTLVGSGAVEALRRSRPAVAVISACSLDVDVGVTMRGREEAEATRALIASADRVIVAVTAGKLGTAASWVAAGVDDVDVLVSDAPGSALSAFARRGVEVREA
jgi:DeoR/GlpR family transcriptional regulator of sugar metabolism